MEREDALVDLLSDLRHYCAQQEEDFEGDNAIAEIHFNEECDEEGA